MQAAILARPKLSDEAEPYFAAFNSLSRYRGMIATGFSAFPLPIPPEAIEKHGLRAGFEDELEEFVEIVAAIDEEHLRNEADRIIAESKTRTAKG
jgi:hypothetical protein